MNTPYQHVIIGSGLIGTVTAIALAKKFPGKIGLIEAKSFSVRQADDPLDTRTLALNAASVQYLCALDLWPQLEADACPIKKIHISEQGAFGSCLLSAEDVEEKYLGQVIEITNLQAVLIAQLREYPNIHLLEHAQVKALEKISDTWTLTLECKGEGQHIQAKHVALADGTHSKLREKLCIPCETFDYHQTAIVAVVRPSLPHNHIAYERFAGTYTLAVLPLTEERVGTVLVLPQKEAEKFLALNDAEYLQALENILGKRLGNFLQIGPRQHYPLQEVVAEKFLLENLVLLGNTAHTLNPMGAQGLNLGLAGVKDYVESLAQENPLNTFEVRQQARCHRLKKFTRQTVRGFSSENFPTRLARRLSLFALQHCDVIKKRFIRRMMGR